MIVLWNTLYINAALEQLVREGHHVKSEDVARLSPLVFDHYQSARPLRFLRPGGGYSG